MKKSLVFAVLFLVASLGFVESVRAADDEKTAGTKGMIFEITFNGYADGVHIKVANNLLKGYRTGASHTTADKCTGVRCTFRAVANTWVYCTYDEGANYMYVLYPNGYWAVYSENAALINTGTWSYGLASAKSGRSTNDAP